MVRKIVLILKIVISLVLVWPIFLVSYLAIWGERYEEKREVIDTVISEDGSHRAVVTKIGGSYGYSDTIEFALFDGEGRQNALFKATVYDMYQGEERYSVEWDTEQVIINVITLQDQSDNFRIVVDYNDLAGRDVRLKDKDDFFVLDMIWVTAYVLFVVSTIILMFSKENRVIFGFTSTVFLLVSLFFTFGFNIHSYDLSLNNVTQEDDPTVKHSLSLHNENYELYQGSLNKVDLYYSCLAPEHKNVFLTTYASGKVDKTEFDVVFHDPDSLTITMRGEDPFEFTLIRE